MWLAIDTATDRASLALGGPSGTRAEGEIVGARRHATGLLPALERCLTDAGGTAGEIEGIVLADGPGSFTGLRVAATVAKALVRAHRMPLWVAPSLLGLARGVQAADGELVVAVSDALRGEIFSGGWRFWPGRVEWVMPPTVLTPQQLRESLPGQARIVGTAAPLVGDYQPSWPRAADLLRLVGTDGGVLRVMDPAPWQPCYGRPAEAQAKWEREHGRALATQTGPPR